MKKFDCEQEVNKLKTQTRTIRKRTYSISKLDKYNDELKALHREGVTISELQRWLRAKRVKIAWSTIYRWIAKHG